MKKEKGRPTKLTQAIQDKITTAIRAGNYIETASAFAGVHKSTLYDWLKRGSEEEIGIYKDFSDAVEKALAISEMKELEIISKCAEAGQWQASAWKLERRFKNRWSRHETLDADVKQTERQEIEIEQKLSGDPEAIELIRQLYRRQNSINEV